MTQDDFKVDNLPTDPNANWEVGFVDGQLLPHGASRELIRAVSTGDRNQIQVELEKIADPTKRNRLIEVIQRLLPIVGKNV